VRRISPLVLGACAILQSKLCKVCSTLQRFILLLEWSVHLYCLYTCTVCTLVQCVHLYSLYACTVCTLVRFLHLYDVYTCTVCASVLSVQLYCLYTCTVCTVVLSVHLYSTSLRSVETVELRRSLLSRQSLCQRSCVRQICPLVLSACAILRSKLCKVRSTLQRFRLFR
jgi:hypothetical protein